MFNALLFNSMLHPPLKMAMSKPVEAHEEMALIGRGGECEDVLQVSNR